MFKKHSFYEAITNTNIEILAFSEDFQFIIVRDSSQKIICKLHMISNKLAKNTFLESQLCNPDLEMIRRAVAVKLEDYDLWEEIKIIEPGGGLIFYSFEE